LGRQGQLTRGRAGKVLLQMDADRFESGRKIRGKESGGSTRGACKVDIIPPRKESSKKGWYPGRGGETERQKSSSACIPKRDFEEDERKSEGGGEDGLPFRTDGKIFGFGGRKAEKNPESQGDHLLESAGPVIE